MLVKNLASDEKPDSKTILSHLHERRIGNLGQRECFHQGDFHGLAYRLT